VIIKIGCKIIVQFSVITALLAGVII